MYQRISYWVKQYGNSGGEDRRAVQDFIECETAEMIQSLKNELYGLSQAENLDDAILDQTIGTKRRVLYKSYTEWAKTMLLWMASYKG